MQCNLCTVSTNNTSINKVKILLFSVRWCEESMCSCCFANHKLSAVPWSRLWNVDPTFAAGRRRTNPGEDGHYCWITGVKAEYTPIGHAVCAFRHSSRSLPKSVCVFLQHVHSLGVSFVHLEVGLDIMFQSTYLTHCIMGVWLLYGLVNENISHACCNL